MRACRGRGARCEDNGPFFENSTRARVNGTETETDRLTDGWTDRWTGGRTVGHRMVSGYGTPSQVKEFGHRNEPHTRRNIIVSCLARVGDIFRQGWAAFSGKGR